MKKIKRSSSLEKATILLVAISLLKSASAVACDACKKQQPKFLQGITHGAGPDSKWDSVIVGIMICITLYVLVATTKCLIRPREGSEQHIKRLILDNQTE